MATKEDLLRKWNNGILRGAQARLAQELGLSQSAIVRWMSGQQTPSEENIFAMSKLFNEPINKVKNAFENIEDINNVFEEENTLFIPVWGIVSATRFKGTNLTEEPIDFVPLPIRDKRIFAMKVKGSCMEPIIKNGEYVILKKQDYIDYDGQIVLAVVDEEYTLKKMFVDGEIAELKPINTRNFKPIKRNLKDVSIRGIYKGVFRKDDFI